MANATPLRYPGGKARLRPYVERLIRQNNLYDAHYVEPFCGGAAVAIELLLGVASRTIIWSLVKQMRVRLIPLFHGLHGRTALER